MRYDEGNVFAKILRGEMPAHKVYEDEATLAFMDIMPRSDGHTLVIPKAPARTILDADPQALADVMKTVQKVARAVKKAFDTGAAMLVRMAGTAIARKGRASCRNPFQVGTASRL